MTIPADELQTMRDELVRARAHGVREVEQRNERVKYGSDAEMAKAIQDLDALIARATGARPNRIGFSASKGL